jgi:hypothetical protein
MPVVSFPSVSSGLSTEELADLVARMIKEVEWLANGNMDSANIRNIAGYNVGPNDLKHSSGLVGMSGANPTDPNAIRFWSGSADPTTAPFRVTQAGIMTAVGGQFQSAAGYPRVELNSANNLIAAYVDPDTYVAFLPSYNTVPALVLVDAGTTKAFLNRGSAASGTTLGTFDSEPLNLQASGPLNLQPAGNMQINGTNGFTGSFPVVTSVTFGPTGGGSYTSKTVTVSKGIITSVI